MPAHIYERTGFYEDAARNNEEAAKVDHAYAQNSEREGSIYDLMYHSHNEHFLAMAACMSGNYTKAKSAADALAARLMPHARMMPMLDAFIMTPIWVDSRFAKWGAILVRPEPLKELLGTHALWRYSRAVAYAAVGNLDAAEKERASFSLEASAFSPDAMLGQQNKASDVLGLASHVIDARIATAKGQRQTAITLWHQAVEIQDALNYDEPADWYYPVRESLGAALLTFGMAADAEPVFRRDLLQNPRNPRSLFGLREALRAQGKTADAAWVDGQFKEAWKNADTELTVAVL